MKKSSSGGWKRRYFVLEGNRIKYFADEAKGRVRGEMELMPDCFVENIQTNDGLCFRIISGGHSLVLRTETDDRYDAWRQALAAAVHRERRSSFVSIASVDSGNDQLQEATMHTVSIGGKDFYVDTKYELIKPVGSGGFGMVVSALDTETQRRVAIKKIHDIFSSLEDAKRIVREVRILRSLHHPHIIRLRDAVPPDETGHLSDVYLVTDLMPTDLHRVIYSRQELTLEHHRFIIYQVVCATAYLHSAGILHRDLKPSNVLINEKCQVKLCDFGLARPLRAVAANVDSDGEPASPASGSSVVEEEEFTEYVVTRWYRAPEVMLVSGHYGTEVDVWSIGCVLGEMLNQKPMFPGKNYLDQLKMITRTMGRPNPEDLDFIRKERAKSFMLTLPASSGNRFHEKFRHHDPEIVRILHNLLRIDPSQRTKLDDLINDPFFESCRDPTIEAPATEKVDLADIEALPLIREEIQSSMVIELVSVRYGNAAAGAHRHRRSVSGVGTNPHGAAARHFLEQDFEALGLDDAIPIKVRRESCSEDQKVDFDLEHHRASESSSGPYEEIAAAANMANAQEALSSDADT